GIGSASPPQAVGPRHHERTWSRVPGEERDGLEERDRRSLVHEWGRGRPFAGKNTARHAAFNHHALVMGEVNVMGEVTLTVEPLRSVPQVLGWIPVGPSVPFGWGGLVRPAAPRRGS